MRYDMPDEKGQTRRERAEDFDQFAGPEIEIPDESVYLWEWFNEISTMVRRVQDGVCAPIPPTEFKAWAEIHGRLVRPSEYAILHQMDLAFCDEMNVEIQAYRLRMEDELKRGAKKNG